MAGGTAFQPNAFQTNAFQIAGGVTATEIQVTIGIVQDDDIVSVRLDVPSEATGGWPIYYPRRKRKVEIPAEIVEPEVIQARLQEAENRLKLRRQLRAQEQRSRDITEQIRSILDEQDRLKLRIQITKEAQSIDDEEAMVAILAAIEQ